jgi:thiamine-phosphate diphosphorylase
MRMQHESRLIVASVARRILPAGMVLGVSTHDPEQARRALADGADYVAVGSVFPTGTKAGFQLVGPDLVRKLRPEIPVPLVGIGGITADNAAEVIEAGADAVAVISAVFGHAEASAIEGAARAIDTVFRAARAEADSRIGPPAFASLRPGKADHTH